MMVLVLMISDLSELMVVNSKLLDSFEEWMMHMRVIECIVDKTKRLELEALQALQALIELKEWCTLADQH